MSEHRHTPRNYKVLRRGHGRKKPLIIDADNLSLGEGCVVAWGYRSVAAAEADVARFHAEDAAQAARIAALNAKAVGRD